MKILDTMVQVSQKLTEKYGLSNITNNVTITSLTSVAMGTNLIRTCAHCYLSNTFSGRVFYGVSTALSAYSLTGTFFNLAIGYGPLHRSILGPLAASFSCNVAGRVCNRINECENLSSSKLTWICVEELIKESKPLKEFFGDVA